MKQRELVILKYPQTDFEKPKIRPALIVSDDKLNNKSQDCIMVPLTSVIKDEPYSFIIEQTDLEKGKLIKKSRIRVDRIISIQKSLVIKSIGVVRKSVFKKIKKEIMHLF
jgi:mRNA interferase MazF